MTTPTGVLYTRQPDGSWAAPGRPILDPPVPPVIDRTKLVPGTYMANNPLYSGLLPGTDFYNDLTDVYPNSSGYISITGPGPYRRLRFWGEVRMQSLTLPEFDECAFAGPNPTTYTQLKGLTKCYGDGYYQWLARNSIFDPFMWGDPNLNRPGGIAPFDVRTMRRRFAYSAGIHGGRATLLHSVIRKTGDGINFVQTITSTNPQAASSFLLVEGCHIHAMNYYWGDDWTDTTDGAHCDCIQFNTGRNVTVRGTYLGGIRNEVGYKLYNGTNGPDVYSYNTGDDAWNAAFMIKQEVGMDDARRLENILIEDNFIEGGAYGINHYYSTTRPHLFETTTIRRNLFKRRADSRYINRNVRFAPCYSENRVFDLDATQPGGFRVGELAPITNG